MYIGVCLNGIWGSFNLFSGLLRGLLRGGRNQINSSPFGLATYTYIHTYIICLDNMVFDPKIGSKRLF